MLRVARMYVSSRAGAEDCVQEAWLGVLQGIDRFEGRPSLRTWVFRILVNIAKTRGQREGPSVPFATLAGDDLDQPTWDPTMFRGPDDESRTTGPRSPSTGGASPRIASPAPRRSR